MYCNRFVQGTNNSESCKSCKFTIVHALYLSLQNRRDVKVFIQLILEFVPSTMDELPSCSQPVNPSHVTINGLSHYCTHNASVNNSI